jgi:hypothetical protein
MSTQGTTPSAERRVDRRGLIAGLVFVVLGVAFLLDELDVLEMRLAYVLPVLLIAAGVWILLGRTSNGGGR